MATALGRPPTSKLPASWPFYFPYHAAVHQGVKHTPGAPNSLCRPAAQVDRFNTAAAAGLHARPRVHFNLYLDHNSAGWKSLTRGPLIHSHGLLLPRPNSIHALFLCVSALCKSSGSRSQEGEGKPKGGATLSCVTRPAAHKSPAKTAPRGPKCNKSSVSALLGDVKAGLCVQAPVCPKWTTCKLTCAQPGIAALAPTP